MQIKKLDLLIVLTCLAKALSGMEAPCQLAESRLMPFTHPAQPAQPATQPCIPTQKRKRQKNPPHEGKVVVVEHRLPYAPAPEPGNRASLAPGVSILLPTPTTSVRPDRVHKQHTHLVEITRHCSPVLQNHRVSAITLLSCELALARTALVESARRKAPSVYEVTNLPSHTITYCAPERFLREMEEKNAVPTSRELPASPNTATETIGYQKEQFIGLTSQPLCEPPLPDNWPIFAEDPNNGIAPTGQTKCVIGRSEHALPVAPEPWSPGCGVLLDPVGDEWLQAFVD